MRKQLLVFSAVALGISMCGATAFAQMPEPQPDRGAIELGFRIGYGIPAGKEGAAAGAPNANLSNDVSGIIPLMLDAGYRVNQNLYLGLSFQYAPAIVNTDNTPACTQSGVSCSGSDVRLGINLHYHLAPGQTFDPWVGIGAGYEWLTLSVSAGGASADVSASGFELANLQLGGDIQAAPNLWIGPFAGVSFGQYRSISLSQPGYPSMDMDLTTKSIHEWIVFGLRGVFDIRLM